MATPGVPEAGPPWASPPPPSFTGANEVYQCVEPEEPQQYRVNPADEGFAQKRVLVIQPLVDGAPDKSPAGGTDQKGYGQFPRDVAKLFMHRGSHNGLGKNVEQIRSHRENTLHSRCHQRRGNDESTPRANAPGDQAGRQPDGNGDKKDIGGIEGGCISGFTPQDRRCLEQRDGNNGQRQ